MTLVHFMGWDTQQSHEYMFWSGSGGVMVTVLVTSLPMLWGAVMLYRHNKCHKCFRLGHHVAHLHYPICKNCLLKEMVNA